MSLRYPVEYNEEGDVLDPQVWNLNQNEFVSEFNGYLDRDNLSGRFQYDRVQTNAFNQPFFVFSDATATLLNPPPIWTSIPNQSLSLNLAHDGALFLEWNGTWEWQAYTDSGRCIAFRVTVDGAEVCASQFFSNIYMKNATYLVACVPVSAGPHTVQLEALVAQVRAYDTSVTAVEEISTGAVYVGPRYLIAQYRRR